MNKLMKTFCLLIASAIFVFASCNLGDTGEVAVVTFNPPAGNVDSGTVVKMSCETPGVTIYYRVGGAITASNYLTAGTEGNEFKVNEAVKLYAIAVSADGRTSKMQKAEYVCAKTYANENEALHLGNPSNAKMSSAYPTNYLLESEYFSMSYNNETLIPNWVAWHLCKDDTGDAKRPDNFHAQGTLKLYDPSDSTKVIFEEYSLPTGWYAVKETNYKATTYGFDRGHMCPNADRDKSVNTAKTTFVMTNMVPQSAANNQKVWANFEDYLRKQADNGKELYIYAGPYGEGGTSIKGYFKSIPIADQSLNIRVPETTWKIAVILNSGNNDIARITNTNATVIAIEVPNNETCCDDAISAGFKTDYWKHFLTTIDAIEEKTGFDFLTELPDDIEATIESTKYAY